MRTLIYPLLWIMNICYKLCRNYGLAIILFTLLSKIILLPLSVWLQYNSIKMVRMQPELNFARVKYFGDKERIAEAHSEIYNKYKYNPFISIIPTVIQLLLLMGVIEVIKAGIADPSVDMMFLGFSLAAVPSKAGGWFLLSPVLAALSALIMCICQNKSNVIQAEQNLVSQIVMLVISVGLSLYLGFFVSVGVALYWIFSNLFATAQLYILNAAINPKKYVDYVKLEESKKALKELENIGSGNKENLAQAKIYAKREKEDYKRFFSVVNKHLVFYSESNGFYKYYAGLIEYLLKNTNIVIHYITSDPNDNIFKMAEEEPRIRGYYIGEKKLITLMMKMDADIVVMTMPDLETYHIKRSYVRNNVEYLYVQHGMGSINMAYRKGALDHFDTILCPNLKQKEEILAQENLYNLKSKKLIECGYFILDDMIEQYDRIKNEPRLSEKQTILIAPSWQEDNIVDSCLDELLHELGKSNYNIIVRPHPQHVRHKREKLEKIKEKYADNPNITVQMDFSATDTVWKADLLVTDWSDIALEYAFCTKKPILFVNTPMKVMNPEYTKIDIVPINIEIREIAGQTAEVDELDKVPEIIDNLFGNKELYEKKISAYLNEQVYNVGKSAEIGGKYIVHQLMERKNKKL